MSAVAERARGRWRDVLLGLGVASGNVLSGRHQACPFCDGKDRFRWTDKDGEGWFICNQCGAGNGFEFIIRAKGVGFVEAARMVESVVGDCKQTDYARKERERAELGRQHARELWLASSPTRPGDIVDRYFIARHGCGWDIYPESIRTAPRCGYRPKNDEAKNHGTYPAMIAVVSDKDGKPVTLHKTYLAADGQGKAQVAMPRLLVPGLSSGACTIRLGDPVGGVLGVAEGIETARAASIMYDGLPVWSCLNAGNLQNFEIPQGVEKLVIFGDNDESYTGQAAAFTLARKAVSKGVEAEVKIPPFGDWDDYYEAERAEGAR